MQPRVGHVPNLWKVCAETTAARLAARAAEDSLKATMIGYPAKRYKDCDRVKHLDEKTGISTTLELLINITRTFPHSSPVKLQGTTRAQPRWRR
jgi:hypothetical protein